MNGFIKDGAREAVDDPERRRIRGVAAQSVLVAFQLCSANIRKINEFLTRKASGGKRLHRLPARRKTRSLTTWVPAPTTVVTDTLDDSSADPDPPLSARERRSPAEVTTLVVPSRPRSVLVDPDKGRRCPTSAPDGRTALAEGRHPSVVPGKNL